MLILVKHSVRLAGQIKISLLLKIQCTESLFIHKDSLGEMLLIKVISKCVKLRKSSIDTGMAGMKFGSQKR